VHPSGDSEKIKRRANIPTGVREAGAGGVVRFSINQHNPTRAGSRCSPRARLLQRQRPEGASNMKNMMKTWRESCGIGILEPIVSTTIMFVMGIPVIAMVIQSGRATVAGNDRVILELRARRYLAEVSTTHFGHASSTVGKPFPFHPNEPKAGNGYQDLVGRCEVEARFEPIADGLARVRTTLKWKDRAMGDRNIAATRLVADPTRSLTDGWTMNQLEP
jgi:hypothetical protein